MTASANQITRAAADRFDREWRVYVGPRRSYVDRTLFTLGSPVTLPATVTLTAEIFAHSTTINVDDTTGWPTSGMVCFRSGEEYAGWWSYSGTSATTFTGAQFVHGFGHQPNGEEGEQYVNITDRVDRASIQGSEYRSGPFILWDYSLAGTRYNGRIMLPDATVIIQERLTPEGSYGTWTDWQVAAVGYVREWVATGDAAGDRPWNATVESAHTYVEPHRITSRSYGRTDLADGASVSASTELANWIDEQYEFLGHEGTTDPDNVTDGFINTLYISQDTPSLTAETAGSSNGADPGVLFQEIFMGSTRDPDLQWITLILAPDSPVYDETGQNLHNFTICNRQTSYVASNEPTWPDEVQGGNYIRLYDLSLTSDNDILVLTNDLQTFRERYNVGSEVAVVDWRTLPGLGEDGMTGNGFEMDSTGDMLQLRYCGAGVEQEVRDMVVWETGGGTPSFALWSGTEDETYSSGQWSPTTAMTPPSTGKSLRRSPWSLDTNDYTDWAEEDEPEPTRRRTSTDEIYVSVELPDVDITLDGAITAGSPGVGDPLTLSSTTDLDAPSGQIMIDSEVIAYSAIVDDTTVTVSARGDEATSAASHSDEAVVSIYDATGAHKMPLVGAVEWRRWARYFYYGTAQLLIVPRVVDIWGSQTASPGYPDGGNWPTDRTTDWLYGWPFMTIITGQSGIPYATRQLVAFPEPLRLRHVMLVVRDMSDGGRGKLNRVLVWRAQVPTLPNPSGETGAGIVLRSLLEEVLETAEITIEAGTFDGGRQDITIGEDSLGQILQDFAADHGLVYRYTRDGGLVVQRDYFDPRTPQPDVEITFTTAQIRSGHEATYPSEIGIGQVTVRVTNIESGDVFEGSYPPQRGPGRVVRVERVGQVSGAEEVRDMARAEFLAHPQINRQFSYQTSGPAEWLEVGQRVLVPSRADETNTTELIHGIVTSVDHGVDGVEAFTLQEWRRA